MAVKVCILYIQVDSFKIIKQKFTSDMEHSFLAFIKVTVL